MNTETITITIGRNIGADAMPAGQWRQFRFNVSVAITDADADATIFVADAKSTGHWNGIAEESRTWVATAADYALDGLETSLARIARRFGQDAIALTTGGATLLVTPRECNGWVHCHTSDPSCGCGPCPACGQ